MFSFDAACYAWNIGGFMKIFKNPKVRDKVILKNCLDQERVVYIVEVTNRSIKVSSVNLLRFNRDGSLNKTQRRDGYSPTIRPYGDL